LHPADPAFCTAEDLAVRVRPPVRE